MRYRTSLNIGAKCMTACWPAKRCSSDEDPFHRPDGTTDWVRWEMEPWRRADGTIGGAVLFSEFITARKETEIALAASKSLLRLAQEVGRIGSWV